MNGFSSTKSTTTTTVVVAVSTSQIAPSTSTKSTDITNSAMPSRVPLLAATISFGHANQVNFQEEPAPNTSSRMKKESKSILATGHLQVQSSANHLTAPNSNHVHQHHHSHQRHHTRADGNAKLTESSCTIRTNNPPLNLLNGKDHKLHYQEEFNKMRERLFRLLSKVPIQVETANNESASSFSVGTSGGSSAAASSSSSSSSQSSGHKKINREPLIIKYYNERALEDILDQHFGCSLIKHNYEHGVPFETHLLKRVPSLAAATTTTNTTFTNNTSTMIQCNCNPLNDSHRAHVHSQCRSVQPENDRLGDDIGCDQLAYADKSIDRNRMSPSVVYTGAVSQFIYDTTDQHAHLADWQCPLVVRCDTGQSTPGDSSWPMQPTAHPGVGTPTKDSISGVKSNPMHNVPNQSSPDAQKGTKYNGKLAAVGQRINGSTEANRRHKRASSSSIIAPRLSSQSRSGCKQQSIMVDGRLNGSNQHSASADNGLPAHSPAICLTASSIKMITNKANYLQQQESLQAVDHFAMNAANGFAPTLQSGHAPAGEIASDTSSSMPMNAADNNFAFNPPLVDLYQQQYHPNYHQQLQHQSHQTSLIYSSPTCGSGQYQPSGLDAGPDNHTGSQSSQQLGSFNQHQTLEVQNESTGLMNAHNFNQQQNRQIYGELDRDSIDGIHLLPAAPGEPYYQASGYLQPAVGLVQQEVTWQQLCQPQMLTASGDTGQFNDEQVQQLQHQQMIDQQQHQQQNRLSNSTSNNNGFLTSESYTEHELGFYLNSNGNYLAYGECQSAINGPARSGESEAPQHENRMNQINQQLDNHHHPINRLS